MNTPNNITVGHAAYHPHCNLPSPAMIPTAPDCGAPCAMCESYAHLLAKAREELEAVRAVLLAAHVTNRGTLAEMAADLVETATSYRNAVMAAREEVARLKQRIIDDNEAYGCELRDPAGTIWDHAAQLQQEVARLQRELDSTCNAEELRQTRAENAALRNSHAAIYLALGTNEADHTEWPAQIVALQAALEKAPYPAEMRHLEAKVTRLQDALDPERIIAAIELPGGHYCDPQAVADAIRVYCSAALAGGAK